MAEFSVPVVRIDDIEEIPDANAIELAVVGEYRSIVQKGVYNKGDLAVYLPEQAVLPEWLIEKIGLTGKLSGKAKNRIKAIKLRGCLSQGVLLKPFADFDGRIGLQGDDDPEGHCVLFDEYDDVAEFLGVTKYDPEIPEHIARKLNGECVYIPGKTVKYDLENWKKHSNLIADGDEVVITEKIHGTLACFASYPGINHPELPDDVFVYSKGLGSRGQVFKWNEANAENLYLKAYHAQTKTVTNLPQPAELTLVDRMRLPFKNNPVFIFGEVFGKGVQDLGYGQNAPTFRAFDIWIGDPLTGGFVDAEIKYDLFKALQLEHVPILYRGPFSKEVLFEHTDGKTTFEGANIREGVVVTPLNERKSRYGRVALKNVSGDYLLRKGNTTEFN